MKLAHTKFSGFMNLWFNQCNQQDTGLTLNFNKKKAKNAKIAKFRYLRILTKYWFFYAQPWK